MSDKKRIENGKFFLQEPGDKYKKYRICWFNETTRQTDGFSARTTDPAIAKERLDKHALEYTTIGDKLKDEPLLTSCSRHFLQYGSKLRSAHTLKRAMEHTMKVLGSPMVSEMGKANQWNLINAWRGPDFGFADATIKRYLAGLWSAMHHAAETEHIQEQIIPKRISAKRWKPYINKGAQKHLSIEELAALLDASCLRTTERPDFWLCKPSGKRITYRIAWPCPQTGIRLYEPLRLSDPGAAQEAFDKFKTQYAMDHPIVSTVEYGEEFVFTLALIATGARSEAVRDIKREQINFEHGILDLNPPGRRQNNKYRPIIPMAPTLQRWLATCQPRTPQGHLMANHGRYIEDTYDYFEPIAKRAGVKATTRSIRRTLSTWLTTHVPIAWERDKFMGWNQHDDASPTGAFYNQYDPRYLRSCSNAAEALLQAIARHMTGDLLQQGFEDQLSPPEAPDDVWIKQWLRRAAG